MDRDIPTLCVSIPAVAVFQFETVVTDYTVMSQFSSGAEYATPANVWLKHLVRSQRVPC